LGKNQSKPSPVDPSPEKKIPHNGFVDVDFLEKGKVRQPSSQKGFADWPVCLAGSHLSLVPPLI
jgi:hypothetical protein